MNVTREQVAAFADDQLTGEEARVVAAAVAADAALQAEVAAHRALRARLTAHFAPVAEAPVPERLQRAASGGRDEVIDFAAARAAHTPARQLAWRRYALPALAASLLVAFVGFNAWLRRGYAHGELAGALDHQVAMTAPANSPVHILLSFRDGAGQYCRAFSADTGSGIACRDERGWRLRDLSGASVGQQTEYRQAGSSDAAIMEKSQAIAAGPALDAVSAAAALKRGWRR